MPKRRRDQEYDSEGSDEDQDRDSYSSEEEQAPARNKRRGGKKPSAGVDQMKMPTLQNTQMKRKIFKKLGYQPKEEQVPEEIFQFLWQVSANEQNTFLKNAREYAAVKILDRPKRRLDAMIDLRMELLQLTDGFYDQVKSVTDRVLSEVHDPEKDEGLLEQDVNSYMACFNVDLTSFDSLLIEEIKSRKSELEDAQKEAAALNERMQQELMLNEHKLKNFLEEQKFNVDVLSAPEREREGLSMKAFNDKPIQLQGMSLIEANMKAKKDAAIGDIGGAPADKSGGGDGRDKAIVGLMSDDEDAEEPPTQIRGIKNWTPKLSKTHVVGVPDNAPGRKFQWPHYQNLEQMDLRKRIKLSGFGIKANTNLYQLKFVFTSNVESETVNSMDGATVDPKLHEIWPEKMIGSVEVLVRNEGGQSNIFGIRFMDHRDRQIQERQWRRSGTARWVKILVPPEQEVIGFHGSHDGSYIKSIGLILWEPNPETKSF